VVTGDSSAPLKRTRVTVLAAERELASVFTDERGRFEIRIPADAPYTLRARKAGFALPDQPRSTTQARSLELRMTKGAVIAGRVVDAEGRAVEIADVHVRRVSTEGGETAASDAATVTDDRGEFRVGSLPAGRYEVHVSDHEWSHWGEPPAANPPRRSVAEIVVNVEVGEERHLTLRHDSVLRDDSQAEQCFFGRCPPGSGVIRGVITSMDGRPLAQASVYASSRDLDDPGGESTGLDESDSRGRFEIRYLRAGTYGVSVNRRGYLTAGYGQEGSARGKKLVLAEGEVREGIDVSLTRGSAIEGRVADRFGEPVEGLSVIVWRVRAPWAATGRVRTARTDDRGRYRLHGIELGAYYVVAIDEPAYDSRRWQPTEPHMYYPAAGTIERASPVEMAAGRDLSGIDITFSPRRGVTVRGRLTDSDGQPVADGVAQMRVLRRAGQISPPSPPYEARTSDDGAFVFSNVLPGMYTFSDSTGDSDLGMRAMTVGTSDLGPLLIKAPRPSTLTGLAVFEGDSSGRRFWHGVAAWPSDVNLGVADADTELGPWTLKPDGTFQLTGRVGAYRVTTVHISWLPTGWWLKSATLGGIDIAEAPFTFKPGTTYPGARLVFAQTAAEVSGRVLEGNVAVDHGSVIVFPTDGRKWYAGSRFVRSMPVGEDGLFRVSGVPPGEYFVVAVADALATEKWARFTGGMWPDRAVLERLKGSARRVLLAERGRASMDVPLSAASVR
jgi:protocatechuate 3,4-dioxygenase beta subunit